jgi:hypothetical protein
MPKSTVMAFSVPDVQVAVGLGWEAGLHPTAALGPAATPYARQRRRGELGALQAAVQPVRFLPGQQHLGGRSGEHGQRRAHRDGVAQTHRALGGGHADAQVALTPEQLGGLSWVWSRNAPRTAPAAASSRSSPAAEASSARRGPRMNRPCMSRETRRWCSRATASRWAVGRAKPVAGHELRQRGGAGLERAQNGRSLVQDGRAESARSPGETRSAFRDGHLNDRGRPEPQDGNLQTTGREGVGPTRGAVGGEGEPDLLYIDLHLVHEVTSPQAFDGLRLAGRPVRRPDLTVATEDHNVPTHPGPIADPVEPHPGGDAARQLRRVRRPSTRSATPSRASSTSSARSWASPSPA